LDWAYLWRLERCQTREILANWWYFWWYGLVPENRFGPDLYSKTGADGEIRTPGLLFTNQDYAVRQVRLRVNKCRLVVTSLVVFWWYGAKPA